MIIAKPIILHDEETGSEYTLEFNREAVKFAEKQGFNINDCQTKPMTAVPELFHYAFRMHHRGMSKEKTDSILFEKLGGIPSGMMERLGQLYAIPFETLVRNEEAEEEHPMKMTVTL